MSHRLNNTQNIYGNYFFAIAVHEENIFNENLQLEM